MTEQTKLLRTPLYSLSSESQAKFTDFAGWEMAVQYSGLKKEHQAVRESVGIFDISHMGKFYLTGKDLKAKLSALVPTDLRPLTPGKAQYTVLLNDRGGIIDDIIYYDRGVNDADPDQETGILIVNASTTTKDWQWLTEKLDTNEIELSDVSQDLALIALQGVKAVSLLNPLISEDLEALTSFAHLTTSIDGEEVFIARTGYTGEDGFEIMTTPEIAKKLWLYLSEQRVTPCGLGARDTLRLEVGMCLYGQDMDDNITPIEAGLNWLVGFDHEYIAQDILRKQKQQGIQQKLVGLQTEGRYIARHGYPLFLDGEKIGEVTSGTLSPTLNKAIALGYVDSKYSKRGQTFTVEIRKKQYPIEVVKKIFYRSPNRLKN